MLPSEAQRLTLLQGFSLPPEMLQDGAGAADTSLRPGFCSIPAAERDVDHTQDGGGRRGCPEMPVRGGNGPAVGF